MRIKVPWKWYSQKLVSGTSIAVGTFLLLEHLYTWDRFDILDFWGHEYLGLGLIAIGFGLGLRKLFRFRKER